MRNSVSQKEFYQKTLMPLGWHFKWNGDECFVDNRGVLLLHDIYDGGWIFSRHETMQTKYVLKHRNDVKPLRIKAFHWDVGSDVINPHFPNEKQKAYDRLLEIVNDYQDKETTPEIKEEFEMCWDIALASEGE